MTGIKVHEQSSVALAEAIGADLRLRLHSLGSWSASAQTRLRAWDRVTQLV